MSAAFVRPDAVEVIPHGLTVRLIPARYGLASAAEVLDFARAAVANVGPEALVYVGHGLSARRETRDPGQTALPLGSES